MPEDPQLSDRMLTALLAQALTRGLACPVHFHL